jgi:hypothetical protein
LAGRETANLCQSVQIANGALTLPFTLLLLDIFGMVRALCAGLGAGLIDSLPCGFAGLIKRSRPPFHIKGSFEPQKEGHIE